MTLPPQNTLQLLSFFDCILLCTTVCTRSCVLSYCCVFQAGKTQSVISCELRGGFTLPLRPVEPVPWNKKSFRWRAILVLLRTLLASIAAAVEITCCSSLLCCCCSVSLLWMMTLLQGGRGGASQSRADKQEGNATLILLPFLFLSISSFYRLA